MADSYCKYCGSAACLLQSPEVCRHTRRPRQPNPEGAAKAINLPPRDKMVRAAPNKKSPPEAHEE